MRNKSPVYLGTNVKYRAQEVFNQFNTNVLGVMSMTRHALHHMRPRRQGVIANFGSLGILVGGLSAMMPERRAEVAALGLRSLVSGTVATCLSGAVAGVLG